MASLDDLRRALDDVAEDYDRFRPRYPVALPADVADLAGLPEDGRILEIGCGTGQLTSAFAQRGYQLLALEPGASLARLARQNCAEHPNVRIERTTFEDWTPSGPFDLVLAAQSFHLIDPARRFALAARDLAPTGALAVVWNYRLPGESAAHRAMQAAYARHAPMLSADQLKQDNPFQDEFDASGLFGKVQMRTYRWTQVYSAAEYVGLLASHGTHHLLPEPSRSALFQAVGEGIQRAGGEIRIEYRTRLFLARRGSLWPEA